MKLPKFSIIGLLLMAMVLSLFTTGCGPAKTLDVVSISPNSTAWVIPLDNQTDAGQVKFNSIDFLNQKKVAAKRIMVDKVKRSTGYGWMNYEWIPAVKVITVDRSLVTTSFTGSSDIGVVTKDSVQLRVGLTITASIDEDDASKYLYFHGERALSDVINQNIRSFAVAELTKEYSQLNLSEAQITGPAIYQKLFDDAKIAFKEKGITIQYLGNAEGLSYADPKVQEAINNSYKASQDAKTAEMEQAAQKIRNETQILNQETANKMKVITAQAEVDAASKLLSAKEAASFQNQLQIALLEAQAKMQMAKSWNGSMPQSVLPDNSPLLMNLGSGK